MNKSNEEIVEEFEKQMPLITEHGKLLCATASPTTYNKIKDWLRTTLTTKDQQCAQKVEEARREEGERCRINFNDK